jgi:glycosyltransferase involved in cell wall biosynthesis
MRKIYILAPNERWICDRLADEFAQSNKDICVSNPNDADVIWIYADWCFDKLPHYILHSKKVITTIHHIVPEKFTEMDMFKFRVRDSFTKVYHVPNIHTKRIVEQYTKKKVHVIPYWANQNIWRPTASKESLRQKYNIKNDSYVIGSFQRDTEGAGITEGKFLPKLEKGPDLFCDYVERVFQNTPNLHVVLAGWRRQYVIERLKKASIPYSYYELPNQACVNELYQILDLYPVLSRVEGGPQSLIECGLTNTPVISRDVGMSSAILPKTAFGGYDKVFSLIPSVPDVSNLILPLGFKPYLELLENF